MDHMMIAHVRQKLVARGRHLLRQCGDRHATRTTSEAYPRSDSFDDLTSDEVRSLSLEDLAMLARIRRSLARIASDMYGGCNGCGAPIEGERLWAMPEIDRCTRCVG